MQISADTINGIIVIHVISEMLDATNANQFKQNVQPYLNDNGRVLFDLKGLRYMDSSGLAAILYSLRVMRDRQGVLKVCDLHPSVRSLFELVRMHKIIDTYENCDLAIESF